MARITVTFIADSSGTSISFQPSAGSVLTLDNVSLKKVITPAVVTNIPIKEFLVGNTDEGKEIHFRVDTQAIQMQPNPEMYSAPLALITETERGSLMKAFISTDGDPFMELEGEIGKGVSVLPIHRSDGKLVPLIAQSVKISYRDSSKQLCRVLQTAVVTTPTTIDHAP